MSSDTAPAPFASSAPAAHAALPLTYLFVPGDRPERFQKAWDGEADALIVDLEDAVAPADKARARDAVAGWLDAARPVWLRVNAWETGWLDDDLRIAAQPGVAGVMLSKAESIPPALAQLQRERGLSIIPLVETARGMAQALELASAPGVQRLAFGSIDFQVDLGIEGEDEELLFFRSQLVWQSRLAGIAPPIDGVSVVLDDPTELTEQARRARRLGFGAKLCIHPRQVGPVQAAFLPTPAERDWAARVLAAIRESGGAAVAVDGKMVDKPVALRAERIAASPEAGMPPARQRA